MRLATEPDAGSPAGISILLVLLFETGALFAREFTRLRLASSGTEFYLAEYLSYLVVPPILLVLGYPLIRQHSAYFRTLLSGQHCNTRKILLALAVTSTIWLMLFNWEIATSALRIYKNNDEFIGAFPRYSVNCAPALEIALGLFVFSVLVPIIEEIINRGIFLKALEARGRIFALTGSSILFAVFHDPQSILSAFVIGMFLGVLYLNAHTLWVPFTVHSVYNAWTIFDKRCFDGNWISFPNDLPVVTVGLYALVLSGVGFILSGFLASRRVIGAQDTPQ